GHPVASFQFTWRNIEVGAAEMGVCEYAPKPGEMFERAAYARFAQPVAISGRCGGNHVGVVRNATLIDAREAVRGADEAAIDVDHWREIQVDAEIGKRAALFARRLPHRGYALRAIGVACKNLRDARRPRKRR